MNHQQKIVLFNDPRIAYPTLEQPFSEYIIKCQTLIATTRIDVQHNSRSSQVIDANTPFELAPPSSKVKAGVLAIHGLLDSPYQFREIGAQLQAQGFLFRTLLLPGHGTVPGALLNIDYQAWVEAVTNAIQSLKKEVNDIILLGNSTGACLALHHLLKNTTRIKGAILISPPIKIYSRFAPIANLPPLLSPIYKKADWFYQAPEETIDYAKYLSMPYNAVYQVYRLSKELGTLNKPSTPCPLLFITADSDKIICPHSILNYFLEHKNPDSKLLLYTDNPLNNIDNRIEQRPCSYSSLHIKNLSHVSLPYSDHNPHYGKNGDYIYASRTDSSKNTVYGEFLRNDLYKNKWQLRWHLTNIRYERLTFNPDFITMMKTMTQFADQCL